MSDDHKADVALLNSQHNDYPLARTKIEVSVDRLVDIHNMAPAGSEIRTWALNVIHKAALKNPKAHWARGLFQTENGDLVFDEARYLHAVYQGKQDTYADAAQKAFDELKRHLDFVATFQEKEKIAIGQEASRPALGRPLVDLTEPSRPALMLKSASQKLPSFVDQMDGGLEVTVSGSSAARVLK